VLVLVVLVLVVWCGVGVQGSTLRGWMLRSRSATCVGATRPHERRSLF
jgi:hypothetical protein